MSALWNVSLYIYICVIKQAIVKAHRGDLFMLLIHAFNEII